MHHFPLASVIGLFLIAMLAGCGSNGSIQESYLYTSSITTTPNPLPPAGGSVKVQVTIVNPPSPNQTLLPSQSPAFDVKDASGTSIFSQPQVFNLPAQAPYNGAFTFTLPSNAGSAAPKVYSIIIHNYQGTPKGYLLPVGTVSVPN